MVAMSATEYYSAMSAIELLNLYERKKFIFLLKVYVNIKLH